MWEIGLVSNEYLEDYGRYDTNTFRCRISVDMAAVRGAVTVPGPAQVTFVRDDGGEGEVPHGAPAGQYREVEILTE